MSETDSEFMARLSKEALDAWKSRALVAEGENKRLRAEDEAIRAEFGGKRDGRPTIECLREAFAAKWSEEDTLFQATLDMKTEELRAEVERLTRSKAVADDLTQQQSDLALKYVVELNEAAAEVARLAAENEKLRTAMLKADCYLALNSPNIARETLSTALQDKSEGEKG